MDTQSISVSPNGTIVTLYEEDSALDIRSLGDHDINRATLIEYDPGTQSFYINPLWHSFGGRTPEFLGYFPTYKSAKDFEVKWINACLSRGLSLSEDNGEEIFSLAESLR